MATNQELGSSAQRVAALAAPGLLAAATALAFGRVFIGHTTTWELLAAALVSVAVAALLERKSLLLATVVSAACLLVAIGLLLFPATTWYGLPSRETLHAIREALGRVGEQARIQPSPTPPLAPLVLAAITAVWAAAFSAHALAIRAGSPLLAVLPPVTLVAFADTVLEDGARPLYAVVFLVAVLLVVFTDGLRRIRQWGPMWGGARRRLSSAAGSGARRVALLAVAAAILAPGILPGFRSAALVDFSTVNGGAVHIDPFVSIQAQLERRTPVNLFRVTSTDAEGQPALSYWRLYALDEFDGTTWRSSDPVAEHGQLVQTPAQLTPTFLPSAPLLEQHYQVLTDLGDRWLPMAYPPQSIDVPFGAVRFDPYLTAAIAPESLDAGTEYTVTSWMVSPTAEQLDRMVFPAPTQNPRYTFVPANVSPQVKKIALRWAAGATSPYRAILALQEHLLAPPFRYDLNVDPGPDSNALVDFLTKTHRGFCQQYATAMAVMVRELGLPARVAVGFLPGAQSGSTFTVSTEQAHSWVEVLFPGYGWLAFDPTPGRSKPAAAPGSYLNPTVPEPCPPGQPGCATDTGSTAQNGAGQATGPARKLLFSDPFRRGPLQGRRRGGGGEVPQPGGYGTLYRLLGLILLAVGAFLLVTVPIAKALWRRAVLGRVRRPKERVLAAYRVFDGEAADLGLGRAEGETLGEHRDRLARSVHFSDGHLDRLTETATQAAYARQGVSERDARDALRDARVAIRDMRNEAGLVRRILGIYRPRV